MTDSEIWAITSFFNPARYYRRRENFREFRNRLGIPLLAVELGFDQQFELRDDDAEILIRKTGGDVMWQKERLLNIALTALPASCRYVAWIDSDLIFARSDWPALAVRALEVAPLVQLFSNLYLLARGVQDKMTNTTSVEACLPALGKGIRSGRSARECFAETRAGSAHAYSASPAWAMRRDVLSSFGFYDACILGGGDSALICAMLGFPDHVVLRHHMNAPRAEHYLEWAKPVAACVGADFAMLDGAAFHLWHGSIADRRYADRHVAFGRFDFDPTRDIAAQPSDAWRWNTDRPDMHAHVAAYFASRFEDGRANGG